MKLLLSGAKAQTDGRTLHVAAGHVDAVLLKAGATDEEDIAGRTALHLAIFGLCRKGSIRFERSWSYPQEGRIWGRTLPDPSSYSLAKRPGSNEQTDLKVAEESAGKFGFSYLRHRMTQAILQVTF